MRLLLMWYVRPVKAQTSLGLRKDCSESLLDVEYFSNLIFLTEQRLQFLSLKGGCIGLYESKLVKMPHC